MIPRIIHLIWINREGLPIPDKYARYKEKWSFLHPDYEVKLWGVKEILGLKDDQVNHLWKDVSVDEGSICNLIRLIVVYRFGGIYADIDTEPIKNFDPLLPGVSFGVGGGGNPAGFDLNLFFSESGNPILAHAIDFYKRSGLGIHKLGQRSPAVSEEMGRAFPTGITIFPKAYFQDSTITPEAYSSHWTHPLRSWIKSAVLQASVLGVTVK